MDQAMRIIPRPVFRATFAPLLVAAATIGAGTVPVAAADAGSDLTIVNPIYVEDQGGAVVIGGPFTASGAAVGDGLICATGTLAELYSHAVTTPDDDFRVIVLKKLTCDDRPGALTLALWVDRVEGVGNEFEWQVLWGTEELEGICGAGDGSGMWAEGVSVIDTYRGGLDTGDRCQP
jgi:hypothetical protein